MGTGFTTLRVLTAPGTLKGVGLNPSVTPVSTAFSSSNPPWALRAGETLYDNIPPGVPIYEVTDYTSSTDVGDCFAAVDAAITKPGYVHFPAGTWTINILDNYGSNQWLGYANSSRRIMGGIGDGADKTFFVEGANMIPSDARAWALAPTNTAEGVALKNLSFSNTSSNTPLFWSGISFDGRFQGPYGVPLSSGLTQNTSTPSPIVHRGLVLNQAIAGSRVQFCRFRGFGFTLKASPPYELAGFESNYDHGLVVYRVEIDGRETSTGSVSAGGYMINYTDKLTIQDSWLHDTRRSGFAMHEHHNGDAGDYTFNNWQVENIAKVADGFAGSNLGFNATNVEEVTGTLVFNNYRAALDLGYHITLGSSADTSTAAQSLVVNDFTSLSTAYNGCLVIRIIKQPNSLGTSPYWNLYNTGGLAALPFTVTKSGKALTPIASGSYNAGVHTPDKYYIVVTQ